MAHPNTPASEPGTAVVQTEKGASALIQAARHRIEPFLFPGQTVERVMQAVYLATKQEPKILNLMDALKKSVAQAQSASGKRMAPSTKGKPASADEKATG